MKIAMAKELFRSGVFKNAHLTNNPDGEGWILELNRAPSMTCSGNEILSNDKGETRVFKGIEAGLKAAETIGFEGIFVSRIQPKKTPELRSVK